MLKIISFTLVFTLSFSSLEAQMWNGTDTLYGNEWIDYDQSYFKVLVAEDGMYRLSKSALESAGVPTNSINGARFQLFHMGQEVPVYASTDLLFNTSDYIAFYGKKNRGDLDRFVYANPDEGMLNPEYSLVSDSAAYFLTWAPVGTPVNRFENVSNDLNNPPAAEAFYLERTLTNFFSSNIKKSNSDFVAESTFDEGEGFGNTFANAHEITLSTSNVMAAGGDATVTVRLVTNSGAHEIAILFNNNEEESDSPNGFALKEYSFNVAASSLAESNTLTIQNNADEFDRTSVSNVWLTYPRSFNFNGENQFIFTVKGGSSSRYIEIENFNTEGQAPVLYDITNNIRIVTTEESGKVKITLPASTGDRTLILSSEVTGYNNVSATATDFTDYRSSSVQFIIISNSKLYNDGNGANFVNEYAQYRTTSQGGNFNTQVVNIQELYDQFAYGINRHFISIRNFGHYIKKEWDDPQYIFIIGKGRDFYQVRTNAQLIGDNASTFTVPTFGSPGADNLLMGSTNSNTPIIPIGRIAVSSPEDIKNYLDKMQIMESGGGAQTIEDQLWKKQLLHLGGGNNTASQQTVIKNHLFAMAEIIENNKFGGKVTSFFKTSSDPIQLGDSDGIFNRINNGVSIVTFFGHSAVGTFDFNIDNPLRYENYAKYPMFLSLGCFSGNIHTSGIGISERFVFLKNKGAVAFGASTGQAYISTLSTFASKYYDFLGDEYYGESIGKVLQETFRNFENNQSFAMVTLSQQFTLHGDPAFRLNPKQGPDYVVDANAVSFDPEVLTATLDSITITFAITNLGTGILDSIIIEVEQELPNGQRELIVRDKVKTPKFEEYLSYTAASFKKASAGQNKLYIRLDVENEVIEVPDPAAEMNNELLNTSGFPGVSFYVFDDSAKPVYPSQFGIVNNPDITLKASTSDGLAPERKYIFQIDTTQLFNSSLNERIEILSKGGVIKWNPNFNMVDSTVYYWRVSPDSISPEAPFIWENSSFIFLADQSSKGWNQSHYFQYKANESQSIIVNEDRRFQFPEKNTVFTLKNLIYDPANKPEGIINNAKWSDFFRWNLQGSLTIVVFSDEGDNDLFGNTYSHLWFNNNPGEYGSVNSTSPRIASFPFPTETDLDRAKIINFLENEVPDSAFVVVYTALRTPSITLKIDEWADDSTSVGDVNLFNLLESYGASQIRSMESESVGALPYVFSFKKSGDAIYENIASDINDVVNFELPVPAIGTGGFFHSVDIGPAREWNKLIWNYLEAEPQDTVMLTVFGISSSGQQDSLFVTELTGEVDLSSINAVNYPHIKLRMFAYDDENFTSVQLNNWTVLYEGLPEAAVVSTQGYVFYNDTLQQGDQGNFELTIENISDYNMDSLLLKYTIVDANNNEKIVLNRVAPLEKEEITTAKLVFDTKDLRGKHRLVLEVNPNEDQPEQYHFNNFAIKQFFVEGDKRNPLLDVTFDGVHLLDNDIVSPKPIINISLKDENQFLSLSDTSLFKLFLKYPGQQVAENIPVNSEWVTFFPALEGGSQNKAAIELRPVFEDDGVYELLVQAEDYSGNQSGDLDYKVSFEVITKSSLSNVLNYPNPFSSSTQFVYTLTGEEIPEYFKIQVLTVSGKIIREITQDELGPLKVGTHKTDFRWNGTDEYGDRLANGVYLYRVVAKKTGGNEYDSFDNGTNSMFKKGFGKLVIIR